ncbi:hypothetical protein ACWC0C_33235 [Streptomyces sp. NPDC001709]
MLSLERGTGALRPPVRNGARCSGSPSGAGDDPHEHDGFGVVVAVGVLLVAADHGTLPGRQQLRSVAWVGGRDDVGYVRPASGATALLRYHAPIGSYGFCTRLLAETGVMVTPGAAFGIEHTVRIGFADDTRVLRTGLDLVGRFLDRLARA